MSSPVFGLTQTAFLFNWVANSSSQQQGTSQQLADYVYWSLYGAPAQSQTNVFPTLLPPGLFPTLGSQMVVTDWALTWGPGVYEMDPSNVGRADNTAYVVWSPSLNLYVVAVAGTDPAAFLDWFEEDLQVGGDDCVNWGFDPTGSQPAPVKAQPGTAQVSLGTAIGLWALAGQLTQSQFAPAATKGQTLGAYLQGLAKTSDGSATFLFTGHSLGGALSPTFAYWFLDLVKAQNNATQPAVYAMPTAGPTPGNLAYQTAWDAAFPQTTVASLPSLFNPALASSPYVSGTNLAVALNNNVWNQWDVVPHAWQYIYTPSLQNTNDPSGPFYFSEPSNNWTVLSDLVTPLGKLMPGDPFRVIANNCQNCGTAAGMTRSAHTTSFPTIWPIPTDSGPVPQPTTAICTSFTTDAAAIHVWGYGNSAFGLSEATFKAIQAIPVVL